MPAISITKLSKVRRKALNLLALHKGRDLGELVLYAVEQTWGAEADAFMSQAADLVALEQRNQPLVTTHD